MCFLREVSKEELFSTLVTTDEVMVKVMRPNLLFWTKILTSARFTKLTIFSRIRIKVLILLHPDQEQTDLVEAAGHNHEQAHTVYIVQ